MSRIKNYSRNYLKIDFFIRKFMPKWNQKQAPVSQITM